MINDEIYPILPVRQAGGEVSHGNGFITLHSSFIINSDSDIMFKFGRDAGGGLFH